jgi:D-alanyl-lipoteichoic acid acyltransferase DltB (MBOAT superfamily)
VNFTSAEFLVFLPAVLLLYAAVLSRRRAREAVLLAASYVFYGSWDWRFAGLLAATTTIDWGLGLALGRAERPGARRALVAASVAVNLGVLAFFKYWDFLVDVAADGAALAGAPLDLRSLHAHVLLPVGISFYTFQSLSYTIDVYRRRIPVERSLVHFAIFVAFFPQLVAGPIVRASDFLPQLHREPEVTPARTAHGLFLVFVGLFQKVAIGDLLGSLAVDEAFAHPGRRSSLDLLLALYGYAFQIHADFAGYSTIAIGLAHMLGFRLPENFDRPYLASNPREFWSRWHVSLSTFLRDYLYVPLGGNRKGPLRTRVNLMLTMLLGGLWHGAAVHFVLWGAWHGALLVLARGAPRRPPVGVRPLALLGKRVVFFHLVAFGWLLFRSPDVATFSAYVRGLAAGTASLSLPPLFLAVLAGAAVLHVLPPSARDRAEALVAPRPSWVQGAVYAAAVLLLSALALDAQPFIYFRF